MTQEAQDENFSRGMVVVAHAQGLAKTSGSHDTPNQRFHTAPHGRRAFILTSGL